MYVDSYARWILFILFFDGSLQKVIQEDFIFMPGYLIPYHSFHVHITITFSRSLTNFRSLHFLSSLLFNFHRLWNYKYHENHSMTERNPVVYPSNPWQKVSVLCIFLFPICRFLALRTCGFILFVHTTLQFYIKVKKSSSLRMPYFLVPIIRQDRVEWNLNLRHCSLLSYISPLFQ